MFNNYDLYFPTRAQPASVHTSDITPHRTVALWALQRLSSRTRLLNLSVLRFKSYKTILGNSIPSRVSQQYLRTKNPKI